MSMEEQETQEGDLQYIIRGRTFIFCFSETGYVKVKKKIKDINASASKVLPILELDSILCISPFLGIL